MGLINNAFRTGRFNKVNNGFRGEICGINFSEHDTVKRRTTGARNISPAAKSIAPMVGRYRNAGNENARTLLDWSLPGNEDAILATAESLIQYGAIKR